MKFEPGESYAVDDNTEITDLFEAPEESSFDAVLQDVNGFHPADSRDKRFHNEKSQKGYYILEGEGTMFVGGEEISVEKGVFVNVPEKTRHAVEGSLRALVVTSPPFDPENEEIVDD